MTCQHCQTWILDEEHRCHRCNRRVRNIPKRIAPSSFPVAAAATAFDYSLEFDEEPVVHVQSRAQAKTETSRVAAPVIAVEEEQGLLFQHVTSDSRVISFDSLTTREERQSIRARAIGLERPAPLKTETVELKRARTRRDAQQNFDFHGSEHRRTQPKSQIICDAAVAPGTLRLQAALVDLFMMSVPLVIGVAIFFYAGGEFTPDKYTLPFFLAALATIPLLYKLLWTIAGADTIGMKAAGLVLVDFDGNTPSSTRRWLRCAGSCISLLAAGIGMVWSLMDEDRLTWHDHISSTFPAVVEK